MIDNDFNPENVEAMLREDQRRRDARDCRFDPISGEGSPCPRRRIDISDHSPSTLYLPTAMFSLPIVEALREKGSFRRAAADKADESRLRSELHSLRMLHDFPYWCATSAKIKCKGGGDDVFLYLNRPQRRLVEIFEEMRVEGRPIRVILLKARQWGGSTCVQLYMAWLQLIHHTGLNSLIIAHQRVATDEIKDMFDRMLDAYPEELLPAEGKKRTKAVGKSSDAVRILGRNCKIKLGSAERPDSCRGGDYNLVHLSEVGVWRSTTMKTPEDIVRSACSGVLLAPNTMIVLESTANGTGNYFHREYLAAMRGKSQFRPAFVAWYEIEQYAVALSDAERSRLARTLWEGRDSTAADDRSDSGQFLFRLFARGATLDAIAWYISERMKYNDHARMASEYPSDEHEAFAHSGNMVFDRASLERLREGCRTASYRGDIVSHDLNPESLDNLYFRPGAGGGLEVWDLPDSESRIADRYLVVVDVGGRSAKADWSVIAVIDRAGMADGRGPSIAAQWRGHCDWDQLAWRAARVAAFYCRALLVVESNSLESREPHRMVDGCELPFILHQIRDVYPNIYARKAGIENLARGEELKLGFHTNMATKPMIIGTLIRVVREGLYEERSDDAVNEMISYERRPNGSYGAVAGEHDDILMTRAIGLHIALYEMEPPRRRLPPAERRQRGRRNRPLSEAMIF